MTRTRRLSCNTFNCISKMLRRAVTSFLGGEQRLSQAVPAAFYATASTDYAIAMKQAGEITAATTSTIMPAEAGYTTGVPLETFNRKVCLICSIYNNDA